MEDLAYHEIAEALDVPIGTVMSRLSRGKAQLRAVLAKETAVANTKVVSFPVAKGGKSARRTKRQSLPSARIARAGMTAVERNGLVFHLYALPLGAMPELPARAVPALVARASQAAAVWSDSKFHYVLATAAGVDALKRLLSAGGGDAESGELRAERAIFETGWERSGCRENEGGVR